MNDYSSPHSSPSPAMTSSSRIPLALTAMSSETVTFADGLVAAWGPENAFLVTTPNATFIPEIIQGIVSVHLRDDGSFGKHDPTLWPQVFTPRFPYLAAIQKDPMTPTHPHAPIWSLPSQDQFVCLPNTPVRGFGHLSREYYRALHPLVTEMASRAREYVPQQPTADLAHLRSYEAAMTRAWERLETICATYRDQLLQAAMVRRYWLLCSAFMTYYDLVSRPITSRPLPANRQLMGAWSTQPAEVQELLALGIHVWLVRASHIVSPDIRVGAFVAPSPPHPLCHSKFHGDAPLYQGLAGEQHLKAIFAAQTYRDVSLLPTANILDPDDYRAHPRDHDRQSQAHDSQESASQSRSRHHATGGSACKSKHRHSSKPKGKATTRPRYTYTPYPMLAEDRTALAHASQIRGRDKFIDPTNLWMPPSLPSWDRAMRAVDRSALAKPANELWGYWIPEPGLLLGPKDPGRAQRYLFNWVLALPVWVYLLQVPGSGAVKVAPQAWRDFLNGVPEEPNAETATGRRAVHIKQIFGRVFADRELAFTRAGVWEAQWHGRRLTLETLDACVAPCVVWEVFELGFRYELLALDRFLRPMDKAEDVMQREARVARVFPPGSLWAVSLLPDEDSWGLFAPLPHRRINALNALREILVSWMRCPLEIKNAEPLQLSDSVETIEEMELWLALFYAQIFFDVSGRAPIVPHRWPGLSPEA